MEDNVRAKGNFSNKAIKCLAQMKGPSRRSERLANKNA